MTIQPEHLSAEYLEGLKAFLRIPSISTLPEHKPDIRRAAEFCVEELRRVGLGSAELIESADGWNPLSLKKMVCSSTNRVVPRITHIPSAL